MPGPVWAPCGTFEWTSNVGLSDVIVLDCQGSAGVGGARNLPRGVGLQVVGHNGDRGTRGEVGLAKNVRHVLVLLWVEILYTEIIM